MVISNCAVIVAEMTNADIKVKNSFSSNYVRMPYFRFDSVGSTNKKSRDNKIDAHEFKFLLLFLMILFLVLLTQQMKKDLYHNSIESHNITLNRFYSVITLLHCSFLVLNLLSCNFTHITNRHKKKTF